MKLPIIATLIFSLRSKQDYVTGGMRNICLPQRNSLVENLQISLVQTHRIIRDGSSRICKHNVFQELGQQPDFLEGILIPSITLDFLD